MSDAIIKRLQEHLNSALDACGDPDWFVICLQGSQNYGVSDEESDIDSKLLVLPSFDQLVLNKPAISYTHIMENDEHCDVKDIREYFKICRKQNINFVEIFFTDWFIVNPLYQEEWDLLQEHREMIATYNKYRTLKTMKGMMNEKYHALCHEYPSRMPWIEKYGFDPKQLSHMVRLLDFVGKYIAGCPYKVCMTADYPEYILKVKRNDIGFTKEEAQVKADEVKEMFEEVVDRALTFIEDKNCASTDALLNDALYTIMTKSIKRSLIF